MTADAPTTDGDLTLLAGQIARGVKTFRRLPDNMRPAGPVSALARYAGGTRVAFSGSPRDITVCEIVVTDILKAMTIEEQAIVVGKACGWSIRSIANDLGAGEKDMRAHVSTVYRQALRRLAGTSAGSRLISIARDRPD